MFCHPKGWKDDLRPTNWCLKYVSLLCGKWSTTVFGTYRGRSGHNNLFWVLDGFGGVNLKWLTTLCIVPHNASHTVCFVIYQNQIYRCILSCAGDNMAHHVAATAVLNHHLNSQLPAKIFSRLVGFINQKDHFIILQISNPHVPKVHARPYTPRKQIWDVWFPQASTLHIGGMVWSVALKSGRRNSGWAAHPKEYESELG